MTWGPRHGPHTPNARSAPGNPWRSSISAIRSRALSAARAAAVAGAVLLAAGAPPAFANDALWALLAAGGQVVLMRHASTVSGVGAPPGFDLRDCATQRNLRGIAPAPREMVVLTPHGAGRFTVAGRLSPAAFTPR